MARKSGIGSHQSANSTTDEWLTPEPILRALGNFDLDPCAPIWQPWKTANTVFTKYDDGLNKDWKGRVWLNPPYGLEAAKWLKKLKEHKNGIALIFARTETAMFFEHVWKGADSILFIEGRLYFHYICGCRAPANSGAPSVLISYNKDNSEILKNSGIAGKFIQL